MLTKSNTQHINFLVKHPVAAFFILAVVLGTSTVYLVVQGILPTNVALASALSASIAGVIVTALTDGRNGLKLMLSRVLIWRVGLRYWFFAILFVLPVILIGSMFNPLFDGDPLSLNNLKITIEILPLFLGFFVVAGLGQELGWTGFLTPRLQSRYNALPSCFIRAILGGLWHLPLFVYSGLQHPALADFPYSGWIAQSGFLVALGILILMFLLPWSIFLSWIFNNTRGSLLLVAILHGSEIWVAYLMMRTGMNPSNLDNYWGYGAVLIVFAILIVITTGTQNLSRKHLRIMHRASPG